jgi:hypothetical protein
VVGAGVEVPERLDLAVHPEHANPAHPLGGSQPYVHTRVAGRRVALTGKNVALDRLAPDLENDRGAEHLFLGLARRRRDERENRGGQRSRPSAMSSSKTSNPWPTFVSPPRTTLETNTHVAIPCFCRVSAIDVKSSGACQPFRGTPGAGGQIPVSIDTCEARVVGIGE